MDVDVFSYVHCQTAHGETADRFDCCTMGGLAAVGETTSGVHGNADCDGAECDALDMASRVISER
jgi:hypothetical protein